MDIWIVLQIVRPYNLVPRARDPLGLGTKGSGIIHLLSPQIVEIRYYCACATFFKMEDMRTDIHTIFLILGRKYEEFFVVLLSFLHNAIYSINYIHSAVTLFKEIHVRLTINRLLTFKTFLQQNYCENINQNNNQYSRSPIKRPLSCTIIISIC